jgi:hypothetical protein
MGKMENGNLGWILICEKVGKWEGGNVPKTRDDEDMSCLKMEASVTIEDLDL